MVRQIPTPAAAAERLTRSHGDPSKALRIVSRDISALAGRMLAIRYPAPPDRLMESLRLEARFARRCAVEQALYDLELKGAASQPQEVH